MLIYQYLNCKIKPNHYIENIEKYLTKVNDNSVVTQEITTPKSFLNDEEEFSIRIEVLDKSKIDSLNYVKLFVDKTETTSSISRYYFVVSKQCISEKIYQLDLQLDIVNTYQSKVINPSLFKQVKINRRHKDRIAKSTNTKLRRIFDRVDEGLGTISDVFTTKEELTSGNCYLVFKQVKDNNFTSQIFKYLYADESKNVNLGQSYYQTTSIPASGHSWFIKPKDVNEYLKIKTASSTCYAKGVRFHLKTTGVNKWFRFELCHPTTGKWIVKEALESMESNFKIFEVYGSNELEMGQDNNDSDFGTNSTLTLTDYVFSDIADTTITVDLPTISEVSNVDDELNQIQELPFRLDWTTTAKYFGDGEIAAPKVVSKDATYTMPYIIDKPASYDPITRNKIYETKLYGSYVTGYSVAYDNASIPVMPERAGSMINNNSITVYVPANMSNNIGIKVWNQREQKLNDNWLITARNNNVTIYNDEYLNYLRNGYNYDIQTQHLSNAKNWLGVASNLAGTGLSAMSKSKTGTLAVYGAIQSGVNTASQIANSIISQVENNNALEQKRQQLINSAIATSGSDNLDLFKTYAGNNVYLLTSTPRAELLDSIWNLFYYNGYADNRFTETMPTIKTREFFNYLQCEIGYSSITNHKERVRIVEAFKEGITYEWNYNDTWLMESNTLYENWEVSL